MKTRYQPFELIDCLSKRGILAQPDRKRNPRRILLPEYGWFFHLKSADLYEQAEGAKPKLLVNLSIHDDSEVIASYIASYIAATVRKQAAVA